VSVLPCDLLQKRLEVRRSENLPADNLLEDSTPEHEKWVRRFERDWCCRSPPVDDCFDTFARQYSSRTGWWEGLVSSSRRGGADLGAIISNRCTTRSRCLSAWRWHTTRGNRLRKKKIRCVFSWGIVWVHGFVGWPGSAAHGSDWGTTCQSWFGADMRERLISNAGYTLGSSLFFLRSTREFAFSMRRRRWWSSNACACWISNGFTPSCRNLTSLRLGAFLTLLDLTEFGTLRYTHTHTHILNLFGPPKNLKTTQFKQNLDNTTCTGTYQ